MTTEKLSGKGWTLCNIPIQDTLSARQWVPSDGTHFPHLFGEWKVVYEEKQREKEEANKEWEEGWG